MMGHSACLLPQMISVEYTQVLLTTSQISNLIEATEAYAASPGEELPVIVQSKGFELNCDSSNCENEKK